MDEAAAAATPHAPPEGASPRDGGRGHRRRWPYILLAAIIAAVGIGYAALSLAPSYIARYLVRTYFQGLAIDTSGVETIRFDPLNGEIRFGPVTFGGSQGAPAQVGQIRVQLDVLRLLERKALVHEAEIAGIRIDIRQAADGAISINGIPLTQILAEQEAKAKAAAAPEPAPPATPAPSPPPPQLAEAEQEAKAWGAGLDQLHLRDSRIVFTDAHGGEATVEVKALDLSGFATWAPDDPGQFSLDGTLNDIHIAMSGTATPFADTIAVDAQLGVTGIAIDRIETYAGPLGFAAKAGTVDLSVDTKGTTVSSDGKVDAQLTGRADLANIDLAHPGFGSLQLQSGAMSLDGVHLRYDASGTIDVAGTASLDLAATALRLNDGTEVGFDQAKAGLPDLHVLMPGSGPPSIGLRPQLDISALRLGGRFVEGTAKSVAIRLADLAVDTQATPAPLTMTGTVDVDSLALLLPLKKPIRIGGSKVSLVPDGLRFVFGTGTTIDGAAGLDITGFDLAVLKHGAAGALLPLVEIAAGTLQGRLDTFALDDTTPVTRVKVAGPSLAIERFKLGAPVAPGASMTIAASALDLKSTDIDVADGKTLEVGGRSTLGAPKFSVDVGPGAAPAVAITDLAIDPRRFVYREVGANSDLGLNGRIDARRIDVRLPAAGDTMGLVELGRLRTAVDDMAFDIDNPAPQWHARRLDLALGTLHAAIPGTLSTLLDVRDVSLIDGAFASAGEYGFEQLAIGHVDASLTRRATNGSTPTTSAPATAAPTTPAEAKPAARPWPPRDLPTVRIGRFGLIEGAKIAMIDQTLSPPVASDLTIRTLAIEDVNTANPAARSRLRFAAALGEGTLSADGWAVPFQAKPDFELRANIDDLRVPDLSSYLAPQIGLDVTAGTLTAAAQATASAGQLEGEVRARLVGLRFADRDNVGTDRVSRSIGVPLSTIFSLLEDRDGSIALTVPFEGDLLSPEFDYSDMIWTGIFRVLRALILSPFKLISASASLLSAKGNSAGADSAPAAAALAPAPLTFAPGTATLAADTYGTLLGMQQILKDRPNMRLKLCGVATPSDGTALGLPAAGAAPDAQGRTRLLELGRQRMWAVQAGLAAGGIDASRLSLCDEPKIAAADTEPPRVELAF